jgi:hypothetical protein
MRSMGRRLTRLEIGRVQAQEAQPRVIRLGLDGRPETPPEEWPAEGGLIFLPRKAISAEQWSRDVAARFRQRPPEEEPPDASL